MPKSAQKGQAERLFSGEFTLEDFSNQISQVLKMGPIGKIMGMLPGEFGKMSQSIDPQEADKQVRTQPGDHLIDDTRRKAKPENPQRQPEKDGSLPDLEHRFMM